MPRISSNADWDNQLPGWTNALKSCAVGPTAYLFFDPATDAALLQTVEWWQFIGLIVPALYLASIGPVGMVSVGKGFLLRTLPGKPPVACKSFDHRVGGRRMAHA